MPLSRAITPNSPDADSVTSEIVLEEPPAAVDCPGEDAVTAELHGAGWVGDDREHFDASGGDVAAELDTGNNMCQGLPPDLPAVQGGRRGARPLAGYMSSEGRRRRLLVLVTSTPELDAALVVERGPDTLPAELPAQPAELVLAAVNVDHAAQPRWRRRPGEVVLE